MNNANNNYLIKVENLSFSYNDSNILQDINIKVEEKDLVAIVGPNGGGKSTFLDILSGKRQFVHGKVEIMGFPATKMRKHIGYVTQNVFYDKHFPIKTLQVVLMGRLGISWKWPWFSKKDKKIAMENLEQLGISHLALESFSSLSGGQKQRVLIARALTTGAKILLFDEPASSLDSSSREQFFHLVQRLNKKYTILIVTHNINAVPKFVKTVFFINKTVDIISLKNYDEHRFLDWYRKKIDV